MSKSVTSTLSILQKNLDKKAKLKNIVDTISEEDIEKYNEGKVICWFSCGVMSAVATKLALDKYPNAEVYYIDTGSEHPDNVRFLKNIEEWIGKKIIVLKNKKYKDHFDVIERTGYINGPAGARCTVELKKSVRFKLEKELGNWTYQIFGFDNVKLDRAKRFRIEYPDAKAIFPLIEKDLSKANCIAILNEAGLRIPEMYHLGEIGK